ncbi:hypothetical protein HOY82DRAFT_418808 [Tuber indicum]|nr:hypothetical protein HOY82DRAFT_418808 [Tuber indicum]
MAPSSRSFLASLGASPSSLGTTGTLTAVVLLLNQSATMVNAHFGECPECFLDCDYARKWESSDREAVLERSLGIRYSSSRVLDRVQCIKDVPGPDWKHITDNGLEELSEDRFKKFQRCACTDKPFVKEVANCLFVGTVPLRLRRQQYRHANVAVLNVVFVGDESERKLNC